jgi:hypothetical protein
MVGGRRLEDVQGDGKPKADARAGAERTIAPVSNDALGTKPTASPRVLRRMNADRVFGQLGTAFHACYEKDAAAAGSVSIVVRLATKPTGEVESVELGASALPPEVADCVTKAAMATKFGAPGGVGVSLSIPATLVADKKPPVVKPDPAIETRVAGR